MSVAAKLVLAGRVHERRDVDIDGTARVDGKPFDIEIGNISATGFNARIDFELRPDDRVVVSAPNIYRREADVVWVRNGVAGFEFVRALRGSDANRTQSHGMIIPFSTPKVGSDAALVAPFPEPVVETWSRRARACSLFAAVTLGWALLWVTLHVVVVV